MKNNNNTEPNQLVNQTKTNSIRPIDYLVELSGLCQALHSAMFGVHALSFPEFSHESIGDDGQLHILIHAIVKALPSKEYIDNHRHGNLKNK